MAGETKLETLTALTKGSYIVIDGVACRVTDTAISKPGKHGSTKMNLMAVGLIDGRKRNFVGPGSDSVEVPLIGKRDAQVLTLVSPTKANVMDMASFETFDMDIPEELQGQVTEGCTIIYWEILNDKVMKQVKSA
ncbi:MAG TPA: translation initiation factor IF-5A [Acidobacteriota bacterium]|nr:translation initiation factor IF-5A [Acidobacteriota bacterium]